MQTEWLVLGGGVGWVLGCRYLLHIWHAQADHRERMAEISVQRAQLDAEVEQHRAVRADRTQRGRAAQEVVEPDWPTSDFSGGLGDEPSVSAGVGDRRFLGGALPLAGPLHAQRGKSA